MVGRPRSVVGLLGTVLLAASLWAISVPAPGSAQQALSDQEIRRLIIQESIRRYSGSCPCPYNVDRAGRRCGRRSAYSRPGGASPLCYEQDVTQEMVERYRRGR